jgi:hypothetical protein
LFIFAVGWNFTSPNLSPKRRCWKSEPTFPKLNPNALPGEALFKGVSTRFGPRIVEKCVPGKRIRIQFRKGWFGLPTSSFGEHKLESWHRVHNNYSSCLCVTRLRVALPYEVNTLLKRTLSNSQLYAPRTKISEGRTNVSQCVFFALCNYVST